MWLAKDYSKHWSLRLSPQTIHMHLKEMPRSGNAVWTQNSSDRYLESPPRQSFSFKELHANRRHTKESFVAKTKGGIRNMFPVMCEGIAWFQSNGARKEKSE